MVVYCQCVIEVVGVLKLFVFEVVFIIIIGCWYYKKS